jgi:hypothetical protein
MFGAKVRHRNLGVIILGRSADRRGWQATPQQPVRHPVDGHGIWGVASAKHSRRGRPLDRWGAEWSDFVQGLQFHSVRIFGDTSGEFGRVRFPHITTGSASSLLLRCEADVDT